MDPELQCECGRTLVVDDNGRESCPACDREPPLERNLGVFTQATHDFFTAFWP